MPRQISLLLCLLVFGLTSVTAAQPPQNPGFGPEKPPVNPVHERQKSEAEQAYKVRRFDKAIELTNSVIRENREDHVAYYLRASAKIEKAIQSRDVKLIREGINDARMSINFAAQDAVSMYYLPYLYGMTNLASLEQRPQHAEVAVSIAQQAIAMTPKPADRANLLYQLGLAYSQLGKHQESAQAFEQAIGLVNEHLGAHIGAADALAKAGQTSEAKAAYDRTVERFPSKPLVYNNRGMFLQKNGQYDQAVVDFTRALEINPKFYTAHTNRGYAFMKQQQFAAAENDFSESLRINPNQVVLFSLRGTSRLLQSKFDDATSDYNQVVNADPRNAVALADLGFARFFAGDFAGAQTAFGRAIEIDQKHNYLNPWISLSLIKSGQAEAARERFATELRRSVDQWNWVDQLLQFANGNLSSNQLLAAVSTDSAVRDAQMCEAYFFIGERLSREGNMEAARQQYEAAVKTGASHLSAFRGSLLALGSNP